MLRTIVISDLLPDHVLAEFEPEVFKQLVADLMAGGRARWIQLAGEKLHTSRRDYINGIQEIELKGLSASVELVGVLPNLIEDGMDPYDMHQTLLGPNVPVGSPGKKQAKGGHYYRAIPFRHQTAGTIGQGGGVPMGAAYEGHPLVKSAAALGRKVYSTAKKLSPTTGHPGGPVKYGGRLPAGLAPKLKEKHSTDIYAGMIRQEKVYKSATQSTYTTFRTISDAVPDKWLHPGIEGAHLADEVHQFLEKIAVKAIEALIK